MGLQDALVAVDPHHELLAQGPGLPEGVHVAVVGEVEDAVDEDALRQLFMSSLFIFYILTYLYI